jgi:biotin carboxyl carrier protein
MNVTLMLDGEPHDIDVEETGEEDVYRVQVGDEPFEVRVTDDGEGVLCSVDDREHDVLRRGRSLVVDGDPVDVGVRELAQASMGAGAAAGGEVTPPMPGAIVEILVEEGQQVQAGDNLLVLEAMKMQNEITAPGDATVEEILVEEDEAVEAEDVLIVLG